MILYGIASARSDDIEDWYLSRDEAEATLASILRDEPDFEGELEVEAVEFVESQLAQGEPRASGDVFWRDSESGNDGWVR